MVNLSEGSSIESAAGTAAACNISAGELDAVCTKAMLAFYVLLTYLFIANYGILEDIRYSLAVHTPFLCV